MNIVFILIKDLSSFLNTLFEKVASIADFRCDGFFLKFNHKKVSNYDQTLYMHIEDNRKLRL
ncbi:hypothetical protein ACA30_08800 [Virgibacillus soli]|nr:hypothetical protein ACA30_08800 [Virgibacillus soli]